MVALEESRFKLEEIEKVEDCDVSEHESWASSKMFNDTCSLLNLTVKTYVLLLPTFDYQSFIVRLL